MDVWRVPVIAHPLLEGLWELLAQAPRPRGFLRYGDLEADWAEGPGVEDRPTPRTRHMGEFSGRMDSALGLGFPTLRRRAFGCYPAGGGLGWHTNSDTPGWRVYLVRSGGGQLLLPGSAVDDRDAHANIFRVGMGTWHAVRAVGDRYVLGFVPDNDFRDDLLEVAAKVA